MTGTEASSPRFSLGKLVSWLFVLTFLLVIVPFFLLGAIVPPNSIGIRQNYYSIPGFLEKGYQNEGLDPGLQWKIPGLSTVILIPRDFQFVQFNDKHYSGDLDLGPLEVPTTDGSKVKTDMTLVFRYYSAVDKKADDKDTVIAPGISVEEAENSSKKRVPLAPRIQYSHGGPRDMVVNLTEDKTRQLQRLSQISDDALRRRLSALSTSDFYNPIDREAAIIAATQAVNAEIAPDGVNLWSALIRRYVYAEKKIDDQIFAKNLQEQTERLNAASSRLAEARANTEKTSALWDAKIRNLEVEGQSNVDVIRSEGNLYEAKKKAEGDLLVASTKADVDAAIANSLASLSGADVYVGKQMVPLLKTLKGGVISGIDPYNISAWVERLIGKQ